MHQESLLLRQRKGSYTLPCFLAPTLVFYNAHTVLGTQHGRLWNVKLDAREETNSIFRRNGIVD